MSVEERVERKELSLGRDEPLPEQLGSACSPDFRGKPFGTDDGTSEQEPPCKCPGTLV
jgi:hypothetical protein